MKVLIALQANDPSYRECFLELLEAARLIAGEGKLTGALLVCGSSCAGIAGEASKSGLSVYVLEDDRFALPHSELFAEGLKECCRLFTPDLVLLRNGMNYLPAAAAAAVFMKCRLITGVEEMFLHDGRIEFRRVVMSGALTMNEDATGVRGVVTLQQGILEAVQPVETSPGEIIPMAITGESQYIPQFLEAAASNREMDSADVIVAAGNGIGEEENLKLIDQLAEIFPSSAVGGSRIVCDRGWLPYNRQIGITGKRVAPRIYIACGISGSSQHLAGMKKSRSIIAINKDPRAPIFNHADYGVAEDLISFIPVLLDAYRREKRRNQ